MKHKIINHISLFILLFSIGMVSCSQETYEAPEEITAEMLDASFTVVADTANTYYITANSNENIISHQWDLDNGLGYATGIESSEVIYEYAGEYTVKHLVIGAGGITSIDSSIITVENTIAEELTTPNLVVGGSFETEDDIAMWTIGGTASFVGVWTFEDNKATLTATAYAGSGIYQAIDVVEGVSYQIDMMVSSTSGCTDTWFEVYCGDVDPATVTEDYSLGTKLLEISTWSGTGTAAFSQKFTTITPNSEANGIFTATSTGTVYLVIRGGGDNMQDGISITDITFNEIIEE